MTPEEYACAVKYAVNVVNDLINKPPKNISVSFDIRTQHQTTYLWTYLDVKVKQTL